MGRRAVGDFMAENRDRLVRFVRSRLSDAAHMDGEDLVQDVMLKMIENPSVTAPIADLSAYVFRALRNRIIDEYRRARPDMISMEGEKSGEDLYEILPDTKYEPRGSMERRMLRREIFEAIRSLPAEQRQVVVETELNGMAMAELARRTATPLGTLLSRKHRGIRKIRKRLEHLKEE